MYMLAVENHLQLLYRVGLKASVELHKRSLMGKNDCNEAGIPWPADSIDSPEPIFGLQVLSKRNLKKIILQKKVISLS
jgi:selenophosphate synthase